MPLSDEQRESLLGTAEDLVNAEQEACARMEMHESVMQRAWGVFDEICKTLANKNMHTIVEPDDDGGVRFRIIDVAGRHYLNEEATVLLTPRDQSGDLVLLVGGDESPQAALSPEDLTEEALSGILADAVVRLLEARPHFT